MDPRTAVGIGIIAAIVVLLFVLFIRFVRVWNERTIIYGSNLIAFSVIAYQIYKLFKYNKEENKKWNKKHKI